MESYIITLYWRIEDFSLLTSTTVDSPQFPLASDHYKFRMTQSLSEEYNVISLVSCNYTWPHFIFSCRIYVSVLLNTGYRVLINGSRFGERRSDLGEIFLGDNDSRSFLLKNKNFYLPDDSLTYEVKFSCESILVASPTVLFARTFLPAKRVSFTWDIIDLSSGEREKSIHNPPLRFRIEAKHVSEVNAYRVSVSGNPGFQIPLPCDVFVKKTSSELVKVTRFDLGPTECSFLISTQFCRIHITDATKMLSLHFRFRILGGKEVSEGFTPKFPVGDATETPSFAFASCSRSCADVQTQFSSDSSKEIVPRPDLIEDITNLYSQQIFSDFTLKAGGRSFPVHRTILSARSVVFRAMFEADMREKRENCSEVKDVDADTIYRMLRFVYSDAFEDSDVESAAKLFVAADKYQIESLKSRCVQFLVSHLTAENVCGVLSLADLHSEETLMTKVKEFVFGNSEEIFPTPNWKLFMAERKDLASAIMHEKLLSQY